MKLILSAILGLLLMQVSADANATPKNQLKKLQTLEVKINGLYEKLESKTQEILPPLKKLDVSQMNMQELVEVQKILAPFYAVDKKLADYHPSKLRRSLGEQNLAQVEKELGHLEKVIKNL